MTDRPTLPPPTPSDVRRALHVLAEAAAASGNKARAETYRALETRLFYHADPATLAEVLAMAVPS